jgi:hypothetical protein
MLRRIIRATTLLRLAAGVLRRGKLRRLAGLCRGDDNNASDDRRGVGKLTDELALSLECRRGSIPRRTNASRIRHTDDTDDTDGAWSSRTDRLARADCRLCALALYIRSADTAHSHGYRVSTICMGISSSCPVNELWQAGTVGAEIETSGQRPTFVKQGWLRAPRCIVG